MEPSVPPARRSPEPSSPPTEQRSGQEAPAPQPKDETPAPSPAKATPAKKAAAAKATSAKKTPVKKATPIKKAAPVKKAAAAKKVAPVKAATPLRKATKTTSTRVAASPLPAPVALPATVPAWLAHAAVERFGDRAERHVRWLRETYPQATAPGLARAVTEHFAGRPWFTALAGTAGLGALLAAQAELVLHIAAAYGRDPRAPQRVPELVDLLAPRGLAASAGSRLAGRWLPGAGLVFGLLADRGALDATARRTVAYSRTSGETPGA